jgi:hypothetical protein
MLRWILGGLAALVVILAVAAYGPGALKAYKFDPTAPDPVLMALYETVAEPERREVPNLHGAEDLEPGPDGRLYASLADGRIMVREIEGGWSEYADTHGRPLGLAFAPDGALFVADALKGLLRLEDDGAFDVWLADESEGGPLVFTDDLTVLERWRGDPDRRFAPLRLWRIHDLFAGRRADGRHLQGHGAGPV